MSSEVSPYLRSRRAFSVGLGIRPRSCMADVITIGRILKEWAVAGEASHAAVEFAACRAIPCPAAARSLVGRPAGRSLFDSRRWRRDQDTTSPGRGARAND